MSRFTVVNPKPKPDWCYFVKIPAFQEAKEFYGSAPIFVKLFHAAQK